MKETQKAKKELGSADIARVMKLLPHRYPFLLVDRLIEMDGDERCIGIKSVTINEPFFQGHFPGYPIMPGELIIEGLAQTAGALCVANFQTTTSRSSCISWASTVPSFASQCCPAITFTIMCARFAAAAVPGGSTARPR